MSPAPYSVLISVYSKSSPAELREAVLSMFDQTVPSDNIVLVEDGPLTPELDEIIADLDTSHPGIMDIVRLPQNRGLGEALNEGLKHCRYDLVARMDSDDISLPDRCERQLAAFEKDKDLDILSGTVIDFNTASTDEERAASPVPGSSIGKITGQRTVPATDDLIRDFSHKRTPFNHPAVMFRRDAVGAAGGYSEEFHLMEDYHLWVRMLMNGSRGGNLSDPLVYMRTDEATYVRRGGKKYARDLKRFHKWLRSSGWSSRLDYLTGAVPHIMVCRMPNCMRALVYKLLR